jgi:O-antigen ligase
MKVQHEDLSETALQPLTTQNKSYLNMVVAICLVMVWLGRIQEVVPFLSHLRIGAVVSAIMILLMVKSFLRNEIDQSITEAIETRYLICLFLLAGISTLFSVYKRLSLQFFIDTLLPTGCFYLFIATSLRSIDTIRRIVWAYALLTIMLGFPSFFAATGLRWATLGSTYDANDTALFMLVSIPILVEFMSVNRGLKRILLGIAALSAVAAIVQSESRGGLLGLAAVLLILLYRTKKLNYFRKTVIVLALALAYLFLTPQAYRERIATIGNEDYNTTDAFGRKQIWQRGLTLMLQNPILGVGPACFQVANGTVYADQVGGVAWKATAHNSFLLVGVEMGFTGGILYSLMLISGIWHARKLQSFGAANPLVLRHLWLGRALEASIVGFIVGSFFLSFCYQPLLYFILALGVAHRTVIFGMINPQPDDQGILASAEI